MTAPYDAFLRSLCDTGDERDALAKLLRVYPSLGKGFVRVRKLEEGPADSANAPVPPDDELDLEDDEEDDERQLNGEDDEETGDGDGETGTNKRGRHRAEVAADLLVRGGRFNDHASALHYVMHTPRGAALLRRLYPTAKRGTSMPTITREQELSSIVKQYGIVALAKKVVDDGGGGTISEHEMTKLITEAAQREHPTLSSASAFARLYGESSDRGTLLRKAIAATKTFSTSAIVPPTAGNAMNALETKAAELRKADPTLTKEQAFARAFTSNPDLAARERRENRPRAA